MAMHPLEALQHMTSKLMQSISTSQHSSKPSVRSVLCCAVLRKAKEVRQQLADIMEQQKVRLACHPLPAPAPLRHHARTAGP